MGAWLEAVNSGKRETVVAYDACFQQPEKSPERLLQLREETGGFVLVRIEQSTPLVVTALLQEKASDAMLRFELTVTDGTPPRIAGAQLEQIETPPELAVPRMSQ